MKENSIYDLELAQTLELKQNTTNNLPPTSAGGVNFTNFAHAGQHPVDSAGLEIMVDLDKEFVFPPKIVTTIPQRDP